MTDQTEPQLTISRAELATLVLDVRTLTLGEMHACEVASGESWETLVKGAVGRRLVALYLRGSRSSGPTPTWSQLSSLTVSDE